MVKLCAVFGSPRRKGNTSLLLRKAIDGARDAGAEVTVAPVYQNVLPQSSAGEKLKKDLRQALK